MRLILAIQAFFAILFGKALPPKALPPPKDPEEPADKKQERERLAADLEASVKKVGDLEAELKGAQEKLSAAEAGQAEAAKLSEELGVAKQEAEEVGTRLEELKAAQEKAADKLKQAREDGALGLLSWMQREGRLIDFLMENVDDYSDEDVGAAVRAIHKGCRKVLEEGLSLEAILPGEEEARVEVPEGFDPVAIQLSGNVKGDPPFKGTLMHHGWRTSKVHVPVPETVDTHVLAAAEVEL